MKNKKSLFRIFGINCAGIKSKLKTFNDVINRTKPKVWMIQETKLKPNELISCEATQNYQVYYRNRQVSQGGGIAMGIDKDIKSTLIREGAEDIEAISVKIFLKDIEIRAITAYGPQENAVKNQKELFWEFIEKEVNDAEFEGNGLFIQMDGNLHAGSQLIDGDPNKQNQNGRLFCELLERNPNLSVVNALDVCQGIITRKRKVENKIEEAILDYFIINEKMRPFVKKMVVDEDREFTLINLAQVKKNKRLIETDHNALIVDMEFDSEKVKTREEIFNLKSRVGQKAFFEETDRNEDLMNIFKNNLSINSQAYKWKKIFNDSIQKCFKKVRVVKNKKTAQVDQLLKERVQIKKSIKLCTVDDEMKEKLEDRIKEIEDSIGEKAINENHKELIETVKELGDDFDGIERRKLWKMLKKKFPKNLNAVPVGKKNKQGKIVTNHTELKNLYLDTYTQRLRNRPMKEEFKEIQDLKKDIFNDRIKISATRKSKPWTMGDLEEALKALKKDKARDPNGWANELFKPGVAGHNLKISLLDFLNKMKTENFIPEFVRMADVVTIYKNKGSKNELVNDRGVFIVTIIRSIMMRLIYFDYYELYETTFGL